MRILILALAVFLAIPAALAGHSEGCVPDQYVGRPVHVDTTPYGGTIYAMWEVYQPSGWSIWIYEESNGLPGLQRGDEIVESETCGHAADTIVF